ncbi:Retinol dehydrogenase 12 [Lobosporangium transversale]|uniref:Uncharacterized protein n=1 Tax=Lobosporangium transversale TaxID=64571 RepID=A0A1Y2GTA0_9FUNG|nr:hypothetical protein BCR41DRAFT_394278 [Lobosporangium transversale]KAF9898204.1 Retinol dehydrogenase 12 [Lobosporangium transversale]ORZ22706.1 hypothetical protein BCR41DRAFT_394278 [Lobosporangium transversale]|eukprot:XP_021883260.1 hypothetical protein BCR41DRAFT_394278 [Lobosporangium transversale]
MKDIGAASMSNRTAEPKQQEVTAAITNVVYIPATPGTQFGGELFDRTVVRLSASRYFPKRLVEICILMVEIIILNIPEWILGEKGLPNVPPVEKRIASSIASSKVVIADAVSKGERRKVAVITGDRATEAGIQAVKSIKAKTGNMNVEFLYLDLGSLKDVQAFVQNVSKRTSAVDLLINNAGVMDLPNFRPTAEGHDSQFGINHLGHYFLTYLLLPLVKKAPKARIVMLTSSAHYGATEINYRGITSAKYYDRIHNYCSSKLATVLFVRHLARSLAKTHPNITVNCLHPGVCYTGLFNYSWTLYIITRLGFKYLLRTPTRGARTVLYLALSEEVEGISGEFWFDERIRQRNPVANDLNLQKELMRYSNKAVGFMEDQDL